jgi:hypothetical protein
VIDGAAVALAGHGASGKSITAAALALRGHGVLSDHRLEIEVVDDVRALPASCELDLWPRAAEMLGLSPDNGAVIRPALPKRAHRFPAADSAPLRLVVVLDQESDVGRPRTTPLLGGESLKWLLPAAAGRVLLEPLGLRPAHFRWMVEIGKAAEVVRMAVDRDLMDPQELADAVEGLLR